MLKGAQSLILCVFLSFACDLQPRITSLFVSPTASSLGDGSECAPFASIDTAVATALAAGGGAIEVLGTRTDRLELSGVVISAQVSINGKGGTIVLKGRVVIEDMGLITFRGLAITAGSEGIEALSVAGRLVITNSTVGGIRNVIGVAGGLVTIENTTVVGCSDFIKISAADSYLNISRVEFQNASGTLILLTGEYTKSAVEVLIFDCVFENNRGKSLIKAEIKNPLATVSIEVHGCRFHNNPALIFDISAFNLKASITLCTFLNNSSGILRAKAIGADISFANCDWISHRGKAIEVSELVGRLALIDSTFRGQVSGSPLFISSSGEAANCFLLCSNTSYTDSTWTAEAREAGFLLLSNCVASVTGLTVRNVTVAGLFGLYNGLVDILRSIAEVRQLSIARSQSSQALLYVAFSSVRIMDSRLAGVGSGLNALSVLSLNDYVAFENCSISGAVGLGASESIRVSMRELLYFVSNLNNLVLREVDIGAGVGEAVVAQFFGNFSVEALAVRNARMHLGLLSLLGVPLTLSGLYVENCTAEALVIAKGRVQVTASNITIVSSHASRIFGCRVSAHCSISNVTIYQSSCNALSQAMSATIEIAGISALSTHMTHVLRGFAGSLQRVSNAVVRDSEAGLVEISDSQAELVNSVFANVTCVKVLMFGAQSNITLRGVAVKGVRSESTRLADLQDLSTLLIVDSDIEDLRLADGVAAKESTVTVVGSTFSHFPFTLITGKSATISLLNSTFHRGGPTGTNPLLRGGVLSCEDCDSVKLLDIRLSSVRASQGGGVYLSNSAATVSRSTFWDCSARNGGALALIDTQFHISDSNFTGCIANGSGGAIDVSNSIASAEVTGSLFSLNTAKVGGALNIRKALPIMKKVSYLWNTAEYGPNVASYTVAARVASAFPTNVSYVSGNPFPQDLNIELLDHFSQVVLTDNIAQFTFSLPASITYGGMGQAVARNGVIGLGTAPFYGPPNSTLNITSSVLAYTGSASRSFGFSWKLSFRPCRLGEVEHADRCEVCPAGKYSLSLNDTECQLCPAHADCPGGFEIDLHEGHWRESANSSHILACPFSAKCLGGPSSRCEEGYTGKMCTECSGGWYRVGTLYCQQCSYVSAIFQVSAFLLQYFSVLFIAFYVSEVSPNDTRCAAFQIWVDYCQCTSMVLRLRIEEPVILVSTYQSLLYLGSLSSAALPVSCLYQQAAVPYTKLQVVSALPVVVLLLLYIQMHLGVVTLTRARVVRLLGLMLYFAGAPVAEAFTALLLSLKFGSSTRWLYEDASIECWEPSHIGKIKYLYSPLLACYILAPLLLVIAATVTLRLRKFTDGYCPILASGLHDTFFFAQFVIYYWKLLFVLVAMGVTARAQILQITLTLSMLIALIPTIVATSVYSSKALLFLSVGSKVVVFCSVGAAAYFMEWSAADTSAQYSFGPAILALHLLTCGFFAKVFIQGKAATAEVYPASLPSGQQQSSVHSSAVLEPPSNSFVDWLAGE